MNSVNLKYYELKQQQLQAWAIKPNPLLIRQTKKTSKQAPHMQFSSIQQIELALRVKKQSESGLFKNQRLLVIKSGFISYYSKIPKQFVGNTRSLELIGEFPKYTLSAQFVTAVSYNYPVLQLIYVKNKLIDRDGFGKMIAHSMDARDFTTPKNASLQTSSWHFKCKELDLANAFVQQVKICMKPEPEPLQDNTSKQPSLQHRKSLQPSFKFVFDAFKQAKQQRQEKDFDQIINQRASNYFSSSQINNQLKNRESSLNFAFLKGRQTVKNILDKGVSLFKTNQQPVLKPIEMPKPYQENIKTDKATGPKEEQTKSIHQATNMQPSSQEVKPPKQKLTISEQSPNQVDAEMFIEGDIEYFGTNQSQDTQAHIESQIQANEPKNQQTDENRQIKVSQSNHANEVEVKDEEQQSLNLVQSQLIQPQQHQESSQSIQAQQNSNKSQELYELSNQKLSQTNPNLNEHDNSGPQNKQSLIDPQNQQNPIEDQQEQQQNQQIIDHQDSDESEDKKSVGKISSIYQNEDSQINQPPSIQRNQSKGSLISLVKVLDPLSSFIHQIKEQSVLQKSPPINQQDVSNNLRQSDNSSSHQAIQLKGFTSYEKLSDQRQQLQQTQSNQNNAFKHKTYKQVTLSDNINKPHTLPLKNHNQKVKQIKKQTNSTKTQQKPKLSHKNYLSQNQQSPIQKETPSQTPISYSFGMKKQPYKYQPINTDYKNIRDQIQRHFRDNIDCRKDKSFKRQQTKGNTQKQKIKSTEHPKDSISFKKFETVKQLTLSFKQSSNSQIQNKQSAISNTIAEANQKQYHANESASDQANSLHNQTNDSSFIQLMKKYKQSKQNCKKYSFIMHTDFINYPSLIDENSDNFFYLNGVEPIQSCYRESTTNCIFSNYSSRLYSKFKCYKFFSAKSKLTSLQEYLENQVTTKLKLKTPLAFYMKYKQFQGLIVQKSTQNQAQLSPQINKKHKINKQMLWKQYSQNLHKNHSLTSSAKMTEKDAMKYFLGHFDLYLIEAIQNHSPYWYLFIEEKQFKEMKGGQIIIKSSLLGHQNHELVDKAFMFKSMQVLKKIKTICVQQLIICLLRSKSANPLNLETAQKHVTINLIQQVLQKVIASQQIQTLLNIQQSLKSQLLSHRNNKRIEFVQNTVIYVLTQLLGFAISSSKEIKHQIKIESNFSELTRSQQLTFGHKQKQQNTLNQFIDKSYLLDREFDQKINHNSLEVLDIVHKIFGKNNQIQQLFNLLFQQRQHQNQQKSSQILLIVNKIVERLRQKTTQILSETEFVLLTLTKIQQSWNQRQKPLKKHLQTLPQLVINSLIKNTILTEFYNKSLTTLQIFSNYLNFDDKPQPIKQSILSSLNLCVEKCINHSNEFVAFLQHNLHLLSKLQNSSHLNMLLQCMQKLIQNKIHSSQSLYYLKNLHLKDSTSYDSRSDQISPLQVIKNTLTQIDFLQKIILNASKLQRQSISSNISKIQPRIFTKGKSRLQIILLELQSSLNPKLLTHEDFTKVTKLLKAFLNQKDLVYMLKCIQILLALWKQNIILDEQIIEIFANLCGRESLVQQSSAIKSTIILFFTQSITIEQKFLYLKKYPEFQKLLFPKSISSFL